MTAWTDLFGTGPVVVDGGLSTQLEAQGEDPSGPLWTGRVLLDRPEAIAAAHSAFVDAGAGVVITASYQVSRQGFAAEGLPPDAADDALRSSVEAARKAAAGRRAGGQPVRVAASVGPYGAILHDGSEYRGDYGLSRAQLADFHAERLEVLVSAGPDLLAIETIPDAREAQALVDVLADHPDVPAWLTFSAVDGRHVCAGQPIEEAMHVALTAPSVVAVGINCTDPRFAEPLVARIRAVTDLPVVLYPNAGGDWDPATGAWLAGSTGEPVAGDVAFGAAVIDRWLRAGATAIGGCCGTDARSTLVIADALARTAP